MLYQSLNEKAQAKIDEIRNYLLENSLQNNAVALDKAISEVISWEETGMHQNYFNKDVNRYLCEALIAMNYDTKCKPSHKILVRGLIESYREIHGLSTSNYNFLDC